MVDFGPTSVTNTPTEFSYNTPLFLMKDDGLDKVSTSCSEVKTPREFKDRHSITEGGKNSPAELVFKTSTTSEGKSLDDSKDSDEGFSSSFSPSSEPQMLQQETSGVNSAFWGSQRDDFLHHELQMGVSSSPLMFSSPSPNSQFSSNSVLRRGTAPGTMPAYSSGTSRRPFPAVSTLLASNKAVATALGVSNWNASPSPSSSWPNHSPNNAVGSNWPQQSRPQLPFPMSMASQQTTSFPQGRTSKFSPFPVASFPQKPYRNARPMPAFSTNSTPSSSKSASPFSHQNSVSNHSGLDMTIVDDITQLTNTFSNLTTSSEVTSNGLFANQVNMIYTFFYLCKILLSSILSFKNYFFMNENIAYFQSISKTISDSQENIICKELLKIYTLFHSPGQ